MIVILLDICLSECNDEISWTVKGTFTWQTTEVNKTAKHKCPYGPNNVTVTRTCFWKSNKTTWGMFDITACNQSKHTMTLLELSQVFLNLSGLFCYSLDMFF